MRWSRERGLPIHHVPGTRRSAVYAYREEVDTWLARDGSRGTGNSTNLPLPTASVSQPSGVSVPKATPRSDSRVLGHRTSLLALAGTLIIGVLGLGYYLTRPVTLPKS